VYRIQIGAFLDHANADRLVERLRTEGFGAATSVFEQSRMLYRVFAVRPEGEAAETASLFLERLRGLGFTVETSDEGSAVTGLVPLRVAVEASRRLREEGIAVRLKQEAGSATFRVVRVGSYATMEEAEQALAALAARGHEGVVVRER
jgi:cell division septation protein DedD